MSVLVPYGAAQKALRVGDRTYIGVDAPPPYTGMDATEALTRALEAPIQSPRLSDSVCAADRVLVIVSDATRDEPVTELAAAVLAQLPSGCRVQFAIATGTHGPCADRPSQLQGFGLPIINHDGHDPGSLVRLGMTQRGTPVVINRACVESDVIVLCGAIRPHYFAGYGGGCKALFPGLGGNAAIRVNHLLKAAPGAALANVVGNPCRDDLEEAAEAITRRSFLLNLVDGPCGWVGAVAGNVRAAFREGVALARPWHEAVAAQLADVVVVAGKGPVTTTLYQAAKLVAAAAPLVKPGGCIVLVADCAGGVGPLQTVNRDIFDLGILPKLPAGVRLFLRSELAEATVRQTRLIPIGDSLEALPGTMAVVADASHLTLAVRGEDRM